MPHQPVIHTILNRPARPFSTFHQPPYSHTPSEDSHQPPARDPARIADSKSEATAIRMLIATITKGKALNQCDFPSFPQLYFSTINPIQPAVAAYSLA